MKLSLLTVVGLWACLLVEVCAQSPKRDRVFLVDGKVIVGKIVKVTDRMVTYRLPKDNPSVARPLLSDIVWKIVFLDGKELIVNAPETEDIPKHQKDIVDTNSSRPNTDASGESKQAKEQAHQTPTASPQSIPVTTPVESKTIEQTDAPVLPLSSPDNITKATKAKKTKTKSMTVDQAKWAIRNKVTVSLALGLSASYPIGQSIERAKDLYKSEEISYSDSVSQLSSSVWPALFVSGGLEIKYQLNQRVTLVSGVRYLRQGFTIKRTYTYKDPIYQYDEMYKGRTHYHINMLDVPIYAQLHLSRRLTIGLGGSIMFAVSERQQRIKYNKTVTINGKKSSEDSIDWQTQINDMSSYTQGLLPTGLFDVSVRCSKKVGIQLRTQYSLNQFKDKGDAKNATAFLGMFYQL
jgi:Outer membrane protein beta-barrel domain